MRRFIYVLPTIAILMALYFIAKKRRGRPLVAESDLGIDDPTALSAAEAAVQDVNLREEFSKLYDFLDSFSTLQGYSEDYMLEIIQMLAKHEISADFLFVESGPSGMMSYTHRQGTFELYVQKGKVDDAIKKIREFIATQT